MTDRTPPAAGWPSALLDTPVIYCRDCLAHLRNLPNGCTDPIYLDPPFNSNHNHEVFCGDTKEKRTFDSQHANGRTPAFFARYIGSEFLWRLP